MQDPYNAASHGMTRRSSVEHLTRSIGFFHNLMARLNKYIERENKKGRDIPRFTKNQIRMIFRYLVRHTAFRHGKGARPTLEQVRVFKGVIREFNKGLPEGWEREVME